MSKHSRLFLRFWLTVAITWALTLQAVGTGAAAGRMLTYAAFDRALLASLCGTGETEKDFPGDSRKHELPACCALGCPLSASHALPDPAAPFPTPESTLLGGDHYFVEIAARKTRPAATPQIPRAPPTRA